MISLEIEVSTGVNINPWAFLDRFLVSILGDHASFHDREMRKFSSSTSSCRLHDSEHWLDSLSG